MPAFRRHVLKVLLWGGQLGAEKASYTPHALVCGYMRERTRWSASGEIPHTHTFFFFYQIILFILAQGKMFPKFYT